MILYNKQFIFTILLLVLAWLPFSHDQQLAVAQPTISHITILDESLDFVTCMEMMPITDGVVDIQQVEFLTGEPAISGITMDKDYTSIRVGLSSPITDFGNGDDAVGVELFVGLNDGGSFNYRYLRSGGQEIGGQLSEEGFVPETRNTVGATTDGAVVIQAGVPIDDIVEFAVEARYLPTANQQAQCDRLPNDTGHEPFPPQDNGTITTIPPDDIDLFADGFESGDTSAWTEVVSANTIATSGGGSSSNRMDVPARKVGVETFLDSVPFTFVVADPSGDGASCIDTSSILSGAPAGDITTVWGFALEEKVGFIAAFDQPPGESVEMGTTFDVTVRSQLDDGSMMSYLFRSADGWISRGEVDEDFNLMTGTQFDVSLAPDGSGLFFQLPANTMNIDVVASTMNESGDRICDFVMMTVPSTITDRINIGGNESGQQSAFTESSGSGGVFAIDEVMITDSTADVQNCATGEVVGNAPNDITSMTALPRDDGSWLVSVALTESPEETANSAFSYAVVVDEVINTRSPLSHLYQVHNNQFLIGQVNQKFQQIPGTQGLVHLGEDGLSVEFIVGGDVEAVVGQAFYMDVEGGTQLCDVIGGETGLMLMGPGEETETQPEEFTVSVTATPQTSCTISSTATVNLREGPGTDFPIASVWNAGQSAQVLAQTTGTDDFTWWVFNITPDNAVFVREDVVVAAGGCANVPPLCPPQQILSDVISDTEAFATCP
ncbi:MAG: hypothetical protein D6737_00140 [Chloroflexi bacterium]|nr:MAG: hypothetical protein D6737_00140 [Chloroflexota bacterium]